MSYTRVRTESFTWPIKVASPSDGGIQHSQTFTGKLKRLRRDQLNEWIAKGDLDLVRAVLVGWDGVNGSDGLPIEFSAAALDDELQEQGFIRGVVEAIIEATTGAQAKN